MDLYKGLSHCGVVDLHNGVSHCGVVDLHKGLSHCGVVDLVYITLAFKKSRIPETIMFKSIFLCLAFS